MEWSCVHEVDLIMRCRDIAIWFLFISIRRIDAGNANDVVTERRAMLRRTWLLL